MTKTMTDTELAEYLGKTRRMLRKWRHEGTGPKFFQDGKSISYRSKDVDEWMLSRTITEDQRNRMCSNLLTRTKRLGTSASSLSCKLGYYRAKLYQQARQMPITPKRLEWLGVMANIEPRLLLGGLDAVYDFPLPPDDIDWIEETRAALSVLGNPGSRPRVNSPIWLEARSKLWWAT